MNFIGTISVTPELLKAKSDELQKVANSVKTSLSEMNNVIKTSSTYWVGDAGDALRKEYEDMNTEAAAVLNRLCDYPVKLSEMSGTYSGHDLNANQQADALPGDVCI